MEYIKAANVPFDTLKGFECVAKVVYIVDGDTVHLVFQDLHTHQYRKVVARLANIDTPELSSEPELAKRARNYLVNYVTNAVLDINNMSSSKELVSLYENHTKLIYAKFLGRDKYSRELVELFESTTDTYSINNLMISSNYAKLY